MDNFRFYNRDQIREYTIHDFKYYIEIIGRSFDIILEVLDNIVDQNRLIDLGDKTDINRNLVIRFFPIVLSCSNTCKNLVCEGEYILAQHIFRLIIELMIKIDYYFLFPEEAYKIFIRKKEKDDIKIFRMLDKLDYPSKSSYKKLYGHFSNNYSHINLHFPVDLFLLNMDKDKTSPLVIGWTYQCRIAEIILYYLASCVCHIILAAERQNVITSLNKELNQKINSIKEDYEILSNNPPK